MIFRKHELLPSEWEQLKPLIQLEYTAPDGEPTRVWNAEIVALVHEIGHICTEMGEDEEGLPKCIKQSPKVAVDIVWVNEVHEAFVPHLVWPSGIGKHSLGENLDNEYKSARNENIY